MKRQCLGLPGYRCRVLIERGSRCLDCQHAWYQRRPSPSRRGHGRAYQALRAQLIGGPCELQGPGCTGVATQADYLVPWSRGGTLADGLRGVCATCNARRGNALAMSLRHES